MLGLFLGAVALGLAVRAGVSLPGFVATSRAPRVSPLRSPASPDAAWKQVAPGVEMRRWNAAEEGGAVAVVALRAEPSRVHIAAGATLDAASWRRKFGALAALNGGFFDPSGHSLGLRVARGKHLHPLRAADWGVFFVSESSAGKGQAGSKQASIVHTRDFKSRRGVTEAIQCGPRLVVGGRPIRLKPQWARRSGIGVQRDGRVVVAVADGAMSFHAWAALWAARDGLNCRDALNLDGGGSTQMSLRLPRGGAAEPMQQVEIGGSWPVPDAIIIQ